MFYLFILFIIEGGLIIKKMSEIALYRKYRPQKFSEVVGQEYVVKILLNAISSGKVSHAYLFCGPRGCGKTTVARLLAKAVNCEKKDNPDPCNKCSSCLEIKEGNAVDLTEIDAASHRGIDEIRELRDGIRFSPAKLDYKVIILDEVHQLTTGAFNALLKMLEEAPSHAIFILATTQPQKVIPTIISRCQRFDFRKITVPEIVKKLKKIAKKEGYEAEDEVLKLIAVAAGGALRDAESLLSQMMSFTLKGGVIRKEDVKDLLGVMEKKVMSDFIDSLLRRDSEGAIKIMDEVFSHGTDPEDFYQNLIHYLREMMVLKIVSGREGTFLESLMATFTKEEIKKIEEQTQKINEEGIRRMIDVFLQAGEKIKYSPIPQLPLELAVTEIAEGSDVTGKG